MPPFVRRLVVAAAAAAAACCIAACADAATVRLLTEENPPFNYTENGRLTGAATDVVLEMARRAAVTVATEVLPWEKAFVRAQAERDTCLFAAARLEHRERLFLWVGPIATNVWAVFGKSDFQPTIRTVKDLAPWRIGAVTRDAKAEYLRENAVTGVRTVDQDAQNPPRLLLPRDHPDHIDLWITGLYAGRAVAKAANVADLKLVFVAGEQPLFLACSPQTQATTVKALADALATMRADGTAARVGAEYERRFAP